MTAKLWFGEGVNIFASYSNAKETADFIVDANKVYWAKTNFLFASILLYALNFDYRTAIGLGSVLWSTILIALFGTSSMLLIILTTGLALVVVQARRRQIWSS